MKRRGNKRKETNKQTNKQRRQLALSIHNNAFQKQTRERTIDTFCFLLKPTLFSFFDGALMRPVSLLPIIPLSTPIALSPYSPSFKEKLILLCWACSSLTAYRSLSLRTLLPPRLLLFFSSGIGRAFFVLAFSGSCIFSSLSSSALLSDAPTLKSELFW